LLDLFLDVVEHLGGDLESESCFILSLEHGGSGGLFGDGGNGCGECGDLGIDLALDVGEETAGDGEPESLLVLLLDGINRCLGECDDCGDRRLDVEIGDECLADECGLLFFNDSDVKC
jgi:hypothetical protein